MAFVFRVPVRSVFWKRARLRAPPLVMLRRRLSKLEIEEKLEADIAQLIKTLETFKILIIY
jgi:hypothetical protein